MEYLSCLLLGFALSFLGQLPLGTISITATQIAVQENFQKAWKYSIGVAIIEMVYLRLVLSGMAWTMHNQILFQIINWGTVIFFLTFGMLGLWAAPKQNPDKKTPLLNNNLDRFLLGLTMSILNAAQIPFWFFWSGYFLNQHWLRPGLATFNYFTLGTGLGTIGGLLLYIYAGNWLVRKMKTSNRRLNQWIGLVFIIAAGVQLCRILRP